MNERHDRNRGPLPAPETRNRDESGSRHWRTGGSDDNVGSLSYGPEGTSARDTTPRGWYAPDEARGGEGKGERERRGAGAEADASRVETSGPRSRPRSIADIGDRAQARGGDGSPWPRVDETNRNRRGESTEGRGDVEAPFREPEGYLRSDARIRADVREVLGRIDGVDCADVEVEVRDGEVTLAGTVAHEREKQELEDRAVRVAGVRHVSDTIRVRRPGADASTRPEPAHAAPENAATKRGPTASS